MESNLSQSQLSNLNILTNKNYLEKVFIDPDVQFNLNLLRNKNIAYITSDILIEFDNINKCRSINPLHFDEIIRKIKNIQINSLMNLL